MEVMPNYTEKDIRDISNDELSDDMCERALAAFNGLVNQFNKQWVENEIVIQRFHDPEIIQLLGRDKMYGGTYDIEKMISVWEDIQILRHLDGFDDLGEKLKECLTSDNVDLELSVIADIARCGATVILEPPNGVGNGKADCQFQLPNDTSWIFVEISRRVKTTTKTQELLDSRGNELAKLVASIKPDRRCVIVLKENVNADQYERIIAWLKTCPLEGEFENLALFFSVPHNSDETSRALEYAKPPQSVRQFGDTCSNAFGVSYLHVPDNGSGRKLKRKRKQLPKDQRGLLIIDLTQIANGVKDWSNQIEFNDSHKHICAVLFVKDYLGDGCKREIHLLENPTTIFPLTKEIKEFLEKFRMQRN